MKVSAGAVALVLCLSVSSASAAVALKLPAEALPVPIMPQATDYSCGAAALLATLVYWGAYEGNENDLYPIIGTDPKNGTEPYHMSNAARRYGLTSAVRTEMTVDDLRVSLSRGETVILDIQAWREEKLKSVNWEDVWEDGHYVVLIAMDAQNAYFMDPSVKTAYGFIPLTELPSRWHDYEEYNGQITRYRHLGIVIKGKEALTRYPDSAIRID